MSYYNPLFQYGQNELTEEEIYQLENPEENQYTRDELINLLFQSNYEEEYPGELQGDNEEEFYEEEEEYPEEGELEEFYEEEEEYPEEYDYEPEYYSDDDIY